MGKFMSWIDARLPVSSFFKNHLSQYYAPKNFNFFYFFGSLALFIFILQIVTGIFLTINYKPDASSAFASVEYFVISSFLINSKTPSPETLDILMWSMPSFVSLEM